MNNLEFFLGSKVIKAKPMTRNEWLSLPRISNEHLNKQLDKDEEGYLVQYENSDNPNIVGYEKYVSWSPKEVFEDSYAKSDELSIGLAFEAMRLGYVVKPSISPEDLTGISADVSGTFSIHLKDKENVTIKTTNCTWDYIHTLFLDNDDYILDTWSIVF